MEPKQQFVSLIKYCDVYSTLTCIYFLLIFFKYSIHENNIFVLKYEIRTKTRKA